MNPAGFSLALRFPDFICDSRDSTVSQITSAPNVATNFAHLDGATPCLLRICIASFSEPNNKQGKSVAAAKAH